MITVVTLNYITSKLNYVTLNYITSDNYSSYINELKLRDHEKKEKSNCTD